MMIIDVLMTDNGTDFPPVHLFELKWIDAT